MANKTLPTDVPVAEFLTTVSEKRQRESELLIEMLENTTNCSPVMWGPSIIGFGKMSYQTKSGCRGIVPKLGFSPRKAKLSFYIMDDFAKFAEELARLGKYKTGVACLYINKLADVDLDVLQDIFDKSWQLLNKESQNLGID